MRTRSGTNESRKSDNEYRTNGLPLSVVSVPARQVFWEIDPNLAKAAKLKTGLQRAVCNGWMIAR